MNFARRFTRPLAEAFASYSPGRAAKQSLFASRLWFETPSSMYSSRRLGGVGVRETDEASRAGR